MALIVNHGIAYDFPPCANCGLTQVSLRIKNMDAKSMDITGSCCSDCGLEFENVLVNGKLTPPAELRCGDNMSRTKP